MQQEDLDSQLLERGQEDRVAGKLREKKMSSGAGLGRADESERPVQGGGLSLRESVMRARKALSLEEARKNIKKTVLSPVKQGTSRLLSYAWGVLIPSFGLSLIYINMHVFLRWVFPDLFCKLGEEWAPKIVASESSAKNIAGTGFGIIEILGLLIIDLILISVILGFLGVIVMVVNFMGASWWGKLTQLWEAIGTLGWSAVNALKNLFESL